MEQKDVLKALQRDHAAELKLAAERLKGTARHTEIIPSPVLSEMTGHEILLKPENLQVTGSFKIRGAYNKIASLTEEQIARGIVTASAGNHAQGVAYAARERGAKATICMPQITPPLKVDATKAYGADVVLYGDVFDESTAHAAELADKEGMIYVPPFDDYEVICGQGTIGLEILEDVPNVTDVVVPLGGGGLGAGVALAIKTFKPEVRVIGAIPEGSPAWKDSLAAGRVSPAFAQVRRRHRPARGGSDYVRRQYRHRDHGCGDSERYDRPRPHHELRGRAAGYSGPARQGGHPACRAARQRHSA